MSGSSVQPQVCVGAVAVQGGELLLIQRGHPPQAGRWSIPGGRVERGETLSAAVRRELREETGAEGEVGELVGWVERIGPTHHLVILDFWVRVTSDGPLRAGSDATAAAWVPLERLGEWDLVDGLLDFLGSHGVIA